VADSGVDFKAPAILRKWPSLRNERVPSAWGGVPYLVAEGTLSECIDEFIAKPKAQHHLYEIHTKAQPPLVTEILDNAELIVEFGPAERLPLKKRKNRPICRWSVFFR
jgi:hypothetical protein